MNERTFLRKLSHEKEMSRNKVFPVQGEEKNTGENEHLETQVVRGNGSVSNGLLHNSRWRLSLANFLRLLQPFVVKAKIPPMMFSKMKMTVGFKTGQGSSALHRGDGTVIW